MQDFEVLDQEDSLRTIELTNGNKLNLKRSDPYGFWTVHYEKGQVPRELSGQYTGPDEAYSAVKQYLQTKQFEETVENKKKNGS